MRGTLQSRRQILVAAVLVGIVLVLPGAAREPNVGASLTPQQVLDRLKEGNARYVDGKSIHPDLNAARREVTAKEGQYPMVTILSCSDSRVPVELVFDQGVGDMFVIRVAGNVCNVNETGSIEYGVEHIGTPLLIVLGHSKCGAVTAATMRAKLHGSIVPVVASIEPAVARAEKEHPDLHGKELLPAATEANVWQSIDDLLKNSSIVRERVKEGKLKVVGALYDVESGKIRWLGERPAKTAGDNAGKSP